MTRETLDHLATLHTEATGGEWLRDKRLVYCLQPSGLFQGKGATYREVLCNRFTASVQGASTPERTPELELEANAELITAMRNALPDLLALASLGLHVREMRERLDTSVMTAEELDRLENAHSTAKAHQWSLGQAGNANVVRFDGDDVKPVATVAQVYAAYIVLLANAAPDLFRTARTLRDLLAVLPYEEITK